MTRVPTTPVRPRRAALGLLTVLALLAASLVGVVGIAAAPPAEAADLSRFDPGLIITDKTFVDSGSMTVAEVQAFLDLKGKACVPAADGTPCLRQARFDTQTRVPDDRCLGTYEGAAQETAAQVIVKVGQACQINPRVLLVMLQKEQGLITGTKPTQTKYDKAMGFRCPDTSPCDPRFFGFFKQVYEASWQLNNYRLKPTSYSHRAGVVNNVRYHPNVDCGSSPVLIRNQSTASLYNYTPYQPNAAALAAGYGTGDSCSSYGNRNFYQYFTDWFGRPDAGDPLGVVEAVTATNTAITVSGWALDPSTSSPNAVHVYVDGVGRALAADLPRPDIGRIFGMGDSHGFSVTVPAAPGGHTVCGYSMSISGRVVTPLGCYPVVVPDRAPLGIIERLRAESGQVTLSGWTWDPDTAAPTDVHVYIDGVGASLRADQPRPDVAAAYGTAPTRGYRHTRALAPGQHTACVYAINTVAGPHTLLGCRTFGVDVAPPIGSIDAVVTSAGSVTIAGWTWDPDTPAPTDVHLYVDGVGASVRADASRPDVAAAYGTAPTRGFSHTRALAPGEHSACVYAINTGQGAHTLLGCRTFSVDMTAPIGVIDELRVTGQQVSISGWSWDPDGPGPTDVHVYVDGVGVSVRADLPRPDVAAAFGTAPTRGYQHTRTLAPGQHTACVYAINTGPGAHTLIGCRPFSS